MNGWGIAFGATGMILSVVTALVTAYRAFRKRVADAARKPFDAGVEAVNEARIALQFKDERLADAQRQAADAAARLGEANARAETLQTQVGDLYARLGRQTAYIAELEESQRASRERETRDRERIRQLEGRVDELTKQLGLGA